MKQLIFIALFTWSFYVLKAQEQPIDLTIESAKTYAMEHNKTIINANSDVQLSEERIRETRGSGLPQMDISVDYLTNFNYKFNFGMGGSSEPPEIDFTKLDEGDVEVLNAINQMSGSSEGSSIVMEDQANANLQVTQLIFSGQYWVGIELAKISKRIAQQNITVTELDVKENVANNYYLILVTRELLEVLNENQKDMEDILKHTSNMFRVGMTEQTDVDQLKINLSQLENSRKVMERNLLLNNNMLRFLLGINSGQEITLTDSLDIFIHQLESDNFLELANDIKDNPNYQIMLGQEEMGKKQVEMQKWAFTPTLSGYYNYREKLMTSSFDLNPKNSAGLSLSIPIISGGTKKAQLSQAKIELDKINRNKELLEEQLALQENQFSYELRNAYENYLTQKENVEIARRVYQSIDNKYRQGLVSSLDLTQANSNYLQAQNNYINSKLTLLQAKLSLDKLYNIL